MQLDLVNVISALASQRKASAYQGCKMSPSSSHRIVSCHL